MATKLLTVNQVAELLVVTPKTVRTWVSDGKIPYRRVGGRSLRFNAEDIDRWSQCRGKTVEEVEA